MVEHLPCKETVGGSSPSIGFCNNSDDRYIGGTISRERLLLKQIGNANYCQPWIRAVENHRRRPSTMKMLWDKPIGQIVGHYLEFRNKEKFETRPIKLKKLICFAYLPSVEKVPWIVLAIHAGFPISLNRSASVATDWRVIWGVAGQ